MTYRGHIYEGWHDGKRKGTYILDESGPYNVDCGSLEDLDRIIKRVIDTKEGLYGYATVQEQAALSKLTQLDQDIAAQIPGYDTREEKSDHGRLDPNLEEGAPN